MSEDLMDGGTAAFKALLIAAPMPRVPPLTTATLAMIPSLQFGE